MDAGFHFEQAVEFSLAKAGKTLRGIPAQPGVFALFGPRADGAVRDGQVEAQPYLTRAADLRRRITRLLAPPELASGQPDVEASPVLSKRLNLRSRVARIEYSVTGSEFESVVTLYHAASAIYGLVEARRRLRLHTPFFLRFTAENAFPRVYSTNRLSRRALANFYGPFPSRAAADRYCDAVLDLFKLRRCSEELAPYPEHPGCVYQEMKRCLAPCNQACSAAGVAAYAAEAVAVEAFFKTRGESLLGELTAQREQASAEMEFERAAELHAQVQRVKAAAALADEIVQPIPQLRAVIVQQVAQRVTQRVTQKPSTSLLPPSSEAEESACLAPIAESEPSAAIFLVEGGALAGPARLSTLGVRAVKEQTSVGSSLFAQPLMLQAVPLAEAEGQTEIASAAPSLAALSPEERAAHVLGELANCVAPQPKSAEELARLSDHLSLVRRWYYRPEKQRAGEVFLPREDASWPIRRILRGAARMALGDLRLADEASRGSSQAGPEAAESRPVRTKTLHKGRPDVERVVPVLGGNTDHCSLEGSSQSASCEVADTLPAAKLTP